MPTGFSGKVENMVKQIAAGGLPSTALLLNEGGGVILMAGGAVPIAGKAGLVKGCCFLKTNPQGRVTEIYSNSGSLASCNFTRTDA